MKFRKKPVVIEAIQLVESNPVEVIDFIGRERISSSSWEGRPEEAVLTIGIRTLEGVMTASLGDWIIRGVAGEVYPCKPEIFAATYELVDDFGDPHQPVLLTDADAAADLAGTARLDNPGLNTSAAQPR